MKKISIAIVLASVLAPFAVHSPASAGLFDIIRGVNTVNNAVNTVRAIQGTIEYTRDTVKGLNELLGLGNEKDRYVKDDSVATAMGLYTDWSKALVGNDKALVQFVLMEQAGGEKTTAKIVKTFPGYDEMIRADQMKLTATYMKLAKILELAQPDEKRFMAYAFCLESGQKDCK
jgi:hypothetical protein